MSKIFAIGMLLAIFAISEIAAHGHLSVPTIRGPHKRQDEHNAPVAFPLGSDFVCRNDGPLDPSKYTVLTAGQTTTMTWAMEAAHPGDCFAYISYDADLPDTQKKMVQNCSIQQVQYGKSSSTNSYYTIISSFM